MKIQQIRNATLKIKYGDQTILLDPWLQDKGTGSSIPAVKEEMNGINSPLNDLPVTPQEIFEGVDYCLVSHIHPDHFTEDYVPKEIKIIAQDEDDKQKIKDMGFTEVTAFEGEQLKTGSVTIHKVHAIHGENEMLAKMMGNVSGFIFSGEEKTLYIAGDTVYCQSVEQTLEKYQPDVIVLNCCEATMPVGRLIMNLSDVDKVCKKAPDALVIATHLDSVNHALLTSDDVRAYSQKNGLKQICVPKNGEWIEV